MHLGIDGCPAGWFAVALDQNSSWKIGVYANIRSLWRDYRWADLILIDIPIGLKDGGWPRACDGEARNKLDKRLRSSVFPTPCRQGLQATTYAEACEINQRVTGKKISRQTWGIIPKIRQVNDFLAEEPAARNVMRETHPEICFQSLANEPIRYNKRSQEGFQIRRRLLQSYLPEIDEMICQAVLDYPGSMLSTDDVLDAAVAAVTAKLGADRLKSLPEFPEFDRRGWRMEIVYFDPDWT